MNESLPIHDGIRRLMRPLSPDEYADLETSLLEDGCRDVLVIGAWPEGRALIDGHHRHRICTEHGLPFSTIEKTFESWDEVLEWIYRNQLGRRNLTTSQRSMYAARLANLRGRRPSKSSSMDELSAPPISRTEAARIANVSTASVDRARRVLEHADEAVIERVESGETSLRSAERLVREVPERPEQRKAVETGDVIEYLNRRQERINRIAKRQALDVADEREMNVPRNAGAATPRDSDVRRPKNLRIVDRRDVVCRSTQDLRVIGIALSELDAFEEIDAELISWCDEMAKHLGVIRRFINQLKKGCRR